MVTWTTWTSKESVTTYSPINASLIHIALIVRRVNRLNQISKPNTDKDLTAEQQELFAVYRYHAVFSDSSLVLVQAEKRHRKHAIIEQVISDLKSGPLAHLPDGSFMANSAWLVLAAMAFNLTRAAGCLASAFHARATTATLRAHLINVPARLLLDEVTVVEHVRQMAVDLPAAMSRRRVSPP